MLLLTLRLLTVAAYGALAVALWRLRGELRPASVPAARVWRWFAVAYGLIALNFLLFEVRLATMPIIAEHPLADLLRVEVYQSLYLIQTLIGASVPIILLVLLTRRPSWRRVAGVAAGAMAVVALLGIGRHALTDWDVLLRSTRVIYFISIAAHLLFWSLFALGAVEYVGTHLAAFMAIETVFVLLIPAQEAFFQALGRADADRLWHINQSLQVITALAQTAVVIRLLRDGASLRPSRIEAVAASATGGSAGSGNTRSVRRGE